MTKGRATRLAGVALVAAALTFTAQGCDGLSILTSETADTDALGSPDSPIGPEEPAATPRATQDTDPAQGPAQDVDTTLVADARQALSTLDVQERDVVTGYERGCGEGEGCVFGPRWTDDHEGPDGHNGCGTRDDTLAEQLTDLKYRNTCVVIGGTFTDPYFGTTEVFTKQDAANHPVDHVIPLALAWDMGADQWPLDKRVQFANDTEYNLVVTTLDANSTKNDLTAAQWLTYLDSPARACDFAARYVLTADRYTLPITPADNSAITEVFAGC